MSILTGIVGIYTAKQRGDLPLRDFCGTLIHRLQLQVHCIYTSGSMDSQCKFEFFPSLCEDADKLEKPPFPDWPSKNLDQDLFPKISPGSVCERLKSGVRLLEVRIASIRTRLNVLRDLLAQPLHPPLNCLTVRGYFLGIRQTV